MFHPVIKHLPLKCGGNVSIQASESHYCYPRNNTGPWIEWELLPEGCPKEALALLAEYDAAGVWAYVPTSVVRAFVKACGGASGLLLHPFAITMPGMPEAQGMSDETREVLNAWKL